MQSIASLVSSVFFKVSQLAGSAKNYIVSKAHGYVEWRLDEMKKKSALIVGLQLENLSFDSIELLFKISLYNPFECYLPISEASFNLKSAGSEVLSGTLIEAVSLKPGEESILFVLTKVPFNALRKLANDISEDADIDYAIDLNITIKLPFLGSISLPIPCKQGEIKIADLISNLLDQSNNIL